jgi:hypothetical protein
MYSLGAIAEDLLLFQTVGELFPLLNFGFSFSSEQITLSEMKGIILAGGVRRSSIEHSAIQS